MLQVWAKTFPNGIVLLENLQAVKELARNFLRDLDMYPLRVVTADRVRNGWRAEQAARLISRRTGPVSV